MCDFCVKCLRLSRQNDEVTLGYRTSGNSYATDANELKSVYRKSYGSKNRESPISEVGKRMIFQGFHNAGKAINKSNVWIAQHEEERPKFIAQSEDIL